jgi:hypothetical protein
MSAKPVQTHKLPTAAELISKQLRAKAESLFKNFKRFDDIEELKKAGEWKTLNRLFSDAGKEYAKVSHRERDRVAWVGKKITSDRDAIAEQNAVRVFCIAQMRSCENVGIEQVRGVCNDKLEFAMDEGMHDATVSIESETPQSEKEKIKTNNPQVTWPGTARQLGDEIFEQFKKGDIAAKNEKDALRKACQHFVWPDGSAFKADSIIQSLKNRKEQEKKEPVPRPRILSTLVKRFANVTIQKLSL